MKNSSNLRHTHGLGALIVVSIVAACGGGEEQDDVPPAVGGPTVSSPPSVGTAGSAAIPPVTPPSSAKPSQAAAGGPAIVTPPAPTATPIVPGAAGSGAAWCGVKKTLDSRCTACHNEQKTAGAPMSLKTYADLQAPAPSDKAKKVFQVVGVRVHDTVRPMPPQEKLTPEQLAGIDTWVAAGAPQGDDPMCAANGPTGSDAPEQVWPTNCDAVYKITANSGGVGGSTSPYMVGAGREIHPQIPVQAPWGSEAVQAIAWRAITDNPKVLHHWILYGGQRQFIVGWAPGKDTNEPYPADVGLYMPGGSLTLDVHYNNLQGTSAEMDASGVELCVLKKANFRPKSATVAQNLSQYLINIPARAVDYDVTGSCTISGNTPITLLSVSPHAHKTAKHMKFTVEKANGQQIVMHDEPFNFEEQTSYALKPPIVLGAGDRVTTTCTFTNPEDRAVTFGENTGNEMCFNFAVYEPMGALNCGGGRFPTGGR
jgi:hypothetical protein